MALHKCKYCHKTVSPRAGSCPHCGEPNPAVSKGCLFHFSLIMGIVLMLLSVAFWKFDLAVFTINPQLYAFGLIVGLVFFVSNLLPSRG